MKLYGITSELAPFAEAADRRFRRTLLVLTLPFLVVSLVVPFLQLPPPEDAPGDDDTERYARLLEQQEPPAEEEEPEAPEPEPEPEPEEPEPEEPEPEETEPEPEPEPAQEAPEPSPRDEVRERYAQDFEGLEDLREDRASRDDRALRSSDDVIRSEDSGRRGSAVAESARERSDGATGGRTADAGNTELSERERTRVEREVQRDQPASDRRSGGQRRDQGRSMNEIQLVFDRNKSGFYTLYNRALRQDSSLRGKVTLRLTIAPDGSVTDVEIIDSQLNEPDLERRILTRVRTLDFGAKDVDTVTVTYPMYFQPS